MIHRALLLLVLGACLAASAPARAYQGQRRPEPGVHEKLADLLFVRPLSLVPVMVGGAFFLISYPVARIGGSPIEVTEVCLTEPLEYTFTRPLGEL